MGTRSNTTVICEEWGAPRPLMTMYRQFDSYPQGYGRELFEFLTGMVVVNGLTGRTGEVNLAGDLAARLVSEFKKGSGGIYIHEPSDDCGAQEYVYLVRVSTIRQIRVEVFSWGESQFSGDVTQLGAWLDKMKEGEEG